MATVCNPCLNVLAIYCASMEVQFATSKTGLDFWYNNFVYELPHELPNDLKTEDLIKLDSNINDRKILEIKWRHRAVSNLPSINQFLVLVIKL